MVSFNEWQDYYKLYTKIVAARVKNFDYNKYYNMLTKSIIIYTSLEEEVLANYELKSLKKILDIYNMEQESVALKR